MSSILKIIVDLQCQIYCDYEQIGEALPNSIFKMELRKGTYFLEFKKEDLCIFSIKYKMESNDEDNLLEVYLFDIYRREINEIKRKEVSKKDVIWIDTGDNWRLVDVNDEELNHLTKESWIDLPSNYNLLPMGQHYFPDVDMCGYIPFNIGGYLQHDDLLGYIIKGGKWGCLSKLGEVVISPIYGNKVFFNNDQVTAVYDYGLFKGIINALGNNVFTEEVYDRVYPIDEELGYYEVYKQDHCGIIDKSGNIVIPLIYSKFSYHAGELIWAQDSSNSKWGLIKFDAKIIQPFIYDEIEKVKDGFYVCRDKKWGTIDNDGNVSIDTRYRLVANATNSFYAENSLDDEYDYIKYAIVLVVNKNFGLKYGVVNTHFGSNSARTIAFTEIVPCKYDAIYSLWGKQYTDEDLIEESSSQLGFPDGSFFLQEVYFVEKIDNHMQCDKYNNDGTITYSFRCDQFNEKYKVLSNKYYLRNKDLKYDSISFDLISSIDFYDGTIFEKGIYPDDWDGYTSIAATDIVTERCKISFLLAKKESEWFVLDNRESNHYFFENNKPTMVLFSCKCDTIDEFGILCSGEYFAIVEIENYRKLFIIEESKIVYESDYMMEIYSSYDALTHSKIAYNEEYHTNGLIDDYFIARLCSDNWQVLKYTSSCENYGVDIFKSPEFDFIRFIKEDKVEVQVYNYGRTIYNTMYISCWENMHPDQIRWKVSTYEERNCNWVAVYDFETGKEGVVIEENAKLSEEEDPVYGGYNIIGKVTEDIIIPFGWDYARVFYSEKNPIIAVGYFTNNKIGDLVGAANEVKCAIMNTRKHFLSSFIFDRISTGFSCQNLCFHLGTFFADVNLVKDDFIYSIPFLNYESYGIGGKRSYGSPFKNVRLFIDTETTGLPLNDKDVYTNLNNWPYLVQVALIIEDDNYGILAKRNIIMKPDGYTIPESSTKIHGITNTKATTEGEQRDKVISFLDMALYNSNVIIGHNVSFDLNVVKSEIIRVKGMENALFTKKKQNVIDTMKIGIDICKIPNLSFYYRQSQPYKYPKLDELYYTLFNKHFDNQHDAMADIQATYDCYYELKKKTI